MTFLKIPGTVASALSLIAFVATSPLAHAQLDSAPLDSGIDLENFDPDVRPQDDFYQYVNGRWLQKTVIPSDRSNFGSFTVLIEQAEEQLRAIVEEAAATTDAPQGSDIRKVGDYYRSFIDSARAETLGVSPLSDELRKIGEIDDRDELVRYLANAQRYLSGAPFAIFINQDLKNTTEYTAYLTQTGLGLPDRDYYFEDRFAEVREEYVAYIETLFRLANLPDPARSAAAVKNIETRLAEDHWTRVQNRDRNATYNKYAVADLGSLAAAVDWHLYFEASGLSVDSIIVRQPSYLEAASRAIGDVPLEDWRVYHQFRLLSSYAPYLSSPFVNAHFDLYGRTLAGTEEIRPRWKRAVSSVESALGEVVGRLYVERHFQPESKQRMDGLVQNLRTAFRSSIQSLDWMSESTKVEALAKLQKFTPKIGYPDKWKSYEGLDVRTDDLVGNVRRSNEHDYLRDVSKLGQPIDRSEWLMTPQTVNAYYNPSMNEVVFPAAILQPPFFNVDADDAVNYGAIGAVIGHEFSHGFDDQGRKSDGDGNLRDWWTEEDAAEFQARAAGLVEQYAGYSPIEGMHVNGELTLGENIGDLAGLTVAYKAYQLSLEGNEAPIIDGLTGDQRFFLGWAQIWRRLYRQAELENRLVTDPHSPSKYRTNGIVSHLPAFYDAFDVKEGDAMYLPPERRIKIW